MKCGRIRQRLPGIPQSSFRHFFFIHFEFVIGNAAAYHGKSVTFFCIFLNPETELRKLRSEIAAGNIISVHLFPPSETDAFKIIRNIKISVIMLRSFFRIQLFALAQISVFCMIQQQIFHAELFRKLTGIFDS